MDHDVPAVVDSASVRMNLGADWHATGQMVRIFNRANQCLFEAKTSLGPNVQDDMVFEDAAIQAMVNYAGRAAIPEEPSRVVVGHKVVSPRQALATAIMLLDNPDSTDVEDAETEELQKTYHRLFKSEFPTMTTRGLQW